MPKPKFAKKLAEVHPIDTLKDYLHHKLPSMGGHRGFNPLHASDLCRQDPKFCPREVALMVENDYIPPNDDICTAQAYTFELGRLIEKVAREQWFRDIAIGDWECLYCGTLTRWDRYPKECEECDMDVFRYIEPVFSIPDANLSCALDLVVELPGHYDKRVIVEVKSIDKDQFKALKAPMVEHRVRTNIYMHAVRESEDDPRAKKVNTDFARVLYMSKSYGFRDDTVRATDRRFSPFKEFVVNYNENEAESYIDVGHDLKMYFQYGQVPKGVCSFPTDRRARVCPMAAKCFIRR